MRFREELVKAVSLDIPTPSRKPNRREIEMASKLVDSLHARFDPSSFHDTYRDRVLDLIKAKASGEEPDLPEPSEPEESQDLMAALEASLGSKS
jgi:DNA end-binding protein Ku